MKTTPLRIKLNPRGGVGVLCKMVKGVFSRAGCDQLKITHNNPCKTRISEFEWIGHPEVIAERELFPLLTRGTIQILELEGKWRT